MLRKIHFTLACGFILHLLLVMHTVEASEVTVKPIVTYNIANSSLTYPSLTEAISASEQASQQAFNNCKHGDNYNCSYSTVTGYRDGTSYRINGEPGSYILDIHQVTVVKRGSIFAEEMSTYDTTGGVHVRNFCEAPFSSFTSGSASNSVVICKVIKPEACPVDGNPINIGTGEKFEYEIDHTTVDGVLNIDRYYVNQYVGWRIQEPARLFILPAESMIFYSTTRVKFSRYDLTEPGFSLGAIIDYYVDYPLELINTLSLRVVYLTLGRMQYRFDENGSNFIGRGISELRKKLTEIDPLSNNGASWKLTDVSGDIYYFSSGGSLLRKQFIGGEEITYQYASGRLSSAVDQSGRSLNYTYDFDGRLTSINSSDSHPIVYRYISDDKTARDFRLLKSVSWDNGESVNYLYDESGNLLNSTITRALTGKIDSYSNRIGTYKYKDNQAVSTEGALSSFKRTFDFGYSYTTVTTGVGASRLYYFDLREDGTKLLTSTSQPGGSGCAASTKTATFYDNGLKKTETDFNGNNTQFAYGSNLLETVRVEGISQADYTNYLPENTILASGVRKLTTKWHSQHNIPVKKSAPKLITTFIYNGDQDPFNGNQIASCAPSSSPMLCHKVEQATKDVNGASGLSAMLDTAILKREWYFTYNSRNQQLSSSLAATGISDEYREYYEAASTDWMTGDVKSITNKLGHKTLFTKYDKNGRLLTKLDVNNVPTTYEYDARGRVKSINNNGSISSYSYDLNGKLISSVLPNGVKTTYEYDLAKRLITIKNSLGDFINYEYDVENNIRFERIKNSAGSIRYIKEHVYDVLSRKQNTIDSKNHTQTYLYDANGNSSGVMDAKNQTTTSEFDSLDQLKKTSNALGGNTEYAYNAQGQITQVKDARNNSTTYTYNAFGDLVSQVSPDTGTTTFTYDAAGNRTSAKDARNVIVNYTYDALNRLTSVTYPASPSENVTYAYDSTANGSYGVGRLSSITKSGATLIYTYNYLGLISQKQSTIGTLSFTTSYSYDVAGNLTGITYPSGRVVTYGRDSAGRVQGITTKVNATAAAQNVVTSIGYVPFGPAETYTFGNGLSHTATYDTDYRLTAIQVGGVLNRSYGYDPVDNITTINDSVATTKNQTFTYDALNRLSSGNGIYGYQAFSYDAVGNRTGMLSDTGTGIVNDTYTYPTLSNRLTSISRTVAGAASGIRSFTYDASGNRTQGTTEDSKVQNTTFNNANRLTTAKVGTTLVGTYNYNALGQRVSKVAGTTKELYLYDESGQLIAVTDANGNTTREYIYNGSQLVSFVNLQGTAIPTTTITLTTNQATLQNAVLATTYTGYTGTSGYIQFNGEGQASWPISIAATANHTIQISYALVSGSRPMDLYVDGVKKTTVSFASTTAWTKWSTASTTLNLTAGNHTLVLKTTGSSGPNLDRIRATPVAGQTGSPVPTTYYVHNDHQGTPQVVTNQAKAVVWMADYQPFGKLQPGQTNTIELYSRFPGQYLDSETGNYYNYFRDYDPSIGRYIESDPIGLAGGINTYAYVFNSPFAHIDPEGLAAVCTKSEGYHHTFVCSDSHVCAGLMPSGTLVEAMTYGPGVILPADYNPQICKQEDAPPKCDAAAYERCIENKTKDVLAKDKYGVLVHNCRDWAEETINACKAQACANTK